MRSRTLFDHVLAIAFAAAASLHASVGLAVIVATPVVTQINPASGPVAGGTVVTITGSNFTAVTGVAFGANAGTAVTCATANQCTATSPAGTGTVSVRVTNSLGTSADTAADDFTFAAPATQYIVIAPATNFPTGTSPRFVTVGDFNGDGKSDLAVAYVGSTYVSILLGTGTGTFGSPTDFTTGTDPASIAIGDFNGDGKSDLAVANLGSNNVSILLGTGTGSFGAPTNFTAGTKPASIAVGDFNGDGKSDLAVANSGSNNVSILLGTGTGTFGAASNRTVGTQPFALAIGDFDGDGKSDLAVANFLSDNVSILLGTGTGTFGAATNYAVDARPFALAIGDFDGDGKRDLAVATVINNNVSILLGTGTGTFGAVANFPAGTTPESVAIGDFDGDGKSDLAVANNGSNDVSILAGTGTGTFGGPMNLPVGTGPRSVAIGDFNGDGKSDLVAANNGSNNVSVLLNSYSSGTFTLSSATYSVNEGAGTVTITINRTGGSDGGVSVNFDTSNGSATAGSDYSITSGSISLGPQSIKIPIAVDITDDNIYEGNETFNFTLSSPGYGATLGVPSSAVITIVDNETQPTVSIGNVTRSEGNNGTTAFTFPVTLSGPSASTVTVNFATSDGTAIAPGDYASNSGTVTFNPGVTSQNITVQVVGDTAYEANETFTVTLSVPVNTTIATGTGTGTITNDDAVPSVSIDSPTQAEGNSGTVPMNFTVTLSAISVQTITVAYATTDGTAAAGSDYATTNGTLTFAPGITTQTIPVPIIGDITNEANETFGVTLSAPANATIATGTGTGTIANDDAVPTLSIDSPSQAEGNSGTTPMNFTVTLSAISGQTVTVAYATTDGTATAGSDYTTTSGALVFAPGVTTQTIPVPIVGDTTNESNETFTVSLATPSNATIATGTGTGTISNDDGVATLSIDSPSQAEGNSGTAPMNFTVTLSAISGQTVTVAYATTDGTATAGSDYTTTSGTLTFAPGITTRTIPVPISGDTTFEPNETFTVTLSSPTNATIATGAGNGTITNDDAGTADLSISKTAVGGAFAGQPLTYNIAVTNNGPTNAAAVVVTDVLPAGVTFVSATPTQGSCSGTTTIICTLGPLTNGGSASISLKLLPSTAGPLSNTASVSAAPQPDSNNTNDSSTSIVTVAPASNIPALGGWATMLLALTAVMIGLFLLKE